MFSQCKGEFQINIRDRKVGAGAQQGSSEGLPPAGRTVAFGKEERSARSLPPGAPLGLGPRRAVPRRLPCAIWALFWSPSSKTSSLSFDLSHLELQQSRCRPALSARPKAKRAADLPGPSDGCADGWPQGCRPHSSNQDLDLIETESPASQLFSCSLSLFAIFFSQAIIALKFL